MLHTLTVLASWAAAHKTALLALAGGSIGLSALAQTVLHKLKVKLNIDSKAFSYTLVQLLAGMASVSAYLVNNNDVLHTWPLLATIVAVVHRYAVSPYYTSKILPYLEYQAGVKSTVAPAAPAVQPVPSFT